MTVIDGRALFHPIRRRVLPDDRDAAGDHSGRSPSPPRRPGHGHGRAAVINLAIAASGLALAQGTSCQAGKIFFALPSFVAIASLLTAVVLLRRKTAKGKAGLPYALGDTIAFFDQLAASADRLGFSRVDSAIVDDAGPGLELTGDRTRAVIVFVRRWLVDALRDHLPADARASAPLLVRFAVQHEICHALNGDHHLYRAARAVAFAQLWWLAGGAALILLIACLWPSPEPCSSPALVTVWLAGAFGLIATACALHRRLVKAFVLRYEIRADSRALIMLSPAERDELLATKKFSTGAPATRIARFLAFLECLRPASRAPFISRLLHLVWPAPPAVSARLSGQPGPETRRDEQWALFGGLSTGVVLMSIVFAFHTVLDGTTMWAALAVAIPIPNAYFVVRSRRATLPGDAGQTDLSRRMLTALGFLAGLFISTLLSIFFFAAPLTAWPAASTSMNGLIVFELLVCVAVTIVCLMTTTGGGNLTTAVETSFESWMTLIPFLFGCVFAASLVGVVIATWQELWETPTDDPAAAVDHRSLRDCGHGQSQATHGTAASDHAVEAVGNPAVERRFGNEPLMDLYETALRLPLNDERLLEIARRAVRSRVLELKSAIEPI